jgi:hypothetical protein
MLGALGMLGMPDALGMLGTLGIPGAALRDAWNGMLFGAFAGRPLPALCQSATFWMSFSCLGPRGEAGGLPAPS